MLRPYTTLFWDFDGVIKDSVSVKSDAFERLFAPFGAELAARVRLHHESNGGMSRYEKFPLYLRWAGLEASEAEVARYCGLFAAAVRQAVIDSPWVPGAREYLQSNQWRQRFVLVTATPQDEIEDILAALGLASCFQRGAWSAHEQVGCNRVSDGAPAIGASRGTFHRRLGLGLRSGEGGGCGFSAASNSLESTPTTGISRHAMRGLRAWIEPRL